MEFVWRFTAKVWRLLKFHFQAMQLLHVCVNYRKRETTCSVSMSAFKHTLQVLCLFKKKKKILYLLLSQKTWFFFVEEYLWQGLLVMSSFLRCGQQGTWRMCSSYHISMLKEDLVWPRYGACMSKIPGCFTTSGQILQHLQPLWPTNLCQLHVTQFRSNLHVI